MKLTFYGAAREVTGSCTLVETAKTKLLIDCGMFQGSRLADTKNFRDFEFDPASLDAVAITHAHLDHSARVPRLIKEGFRKNVYATEGTKMIAGIVMEDAEHIMQDEFERDGRPKLYDANDVQKTLSKMQSVNYGETVAIKDLTIQFFDAGHIFGSSFVRVTDKEGKTAVFSGDLGNRDVPIIRETDPMGPADAVVIESTYGNRIHEGKKERYQQLKDAIVSTMQQSGVLLIPAFSIERTQHVLYEINHLVETKKIPRIRVYLDSPMAIKATNVMKKIPRYYDKEALRLISEGDDFLMFPGLEITRTRDESKAINMAPSPKVIIAGSGMMTGGRIQHHLIRYLGDPTTTLLIIGYQAYGTLGRKLYSGDKNVRIFGKRVRVRAKVKAIGAYSAHADQKKLIEWIKTSKPLPKLVLCNHGEDETAVAFATRVQDQLGIEARAPKYGESYTL